MVRAAATDVRDTGVARGELATVPDDARRAIKSTMIRLLGLSESIVIRGFGQASVLSKNRVELRQHPSEAAAREVHILGLPAEGNNAFPGGRCNLMRLRVGY